MRKKLPLGSLLMLLVFMLGGFSTAVAQTVAASGYIASISPADGATIPGFLDADENPDSEYSRLTVKFNETPAFFVFSLYTNVGGEDDGFAGSWNMSEFTVNSDGSYEKVFHWNYPIDEGNTGKGVFTFYSDAMMSSELGSQEVTWIGNSTLKGSEAEVISIFPANNSTLNLNADGSATIEISFSAAVTCRAAVPAGRGSETAVSATANDDETVWTVTVPANIVNQLVEDYGALLVNVYATDGMGNDVYYEGMPSIALSYSVDVEKVEGADFNVSLENQEVEAPVESFTVSAAKAISANDYNQVLEVDGKWQTINAYQSISVFNEAGELVTKVAPLASGEGGFNGTVTFVTPISEAGVYTMILPYSAFSIGEESSSESSMAKTVEFTVLQGEPGTGGDDYEIETGKAYTVNYQSPVYTFTAPADGTLSAQWNTYSTALTQGQMQFFLFTNEGLTELANPISIGGGDGGVLVKFSVKKGEKYYLFSENFAPLTVVFSFEAGSTAKAVITSIEPTPGTAYDVVNFRTAWNLLCSPTTATVERIELTYVEAATGESTTIECPAAEFAGDALRILSSNLVMRLEGNEIMAGTDVVYTLYGLKAGNSYVTEYTGPGKDYVVVEENGLVKVTFGTGKPITVLSEDFPTPLYQNFDGADNAVATLTFSGNIADVGEVSVVEGHIVPGGGATSGDNPPEFVYLPKDKVTFKGNTLSINFAGVDMSNIPEGKATVVITGVLGENGLYANYDGYAVYTYYTDMVAGSGISAVVEDQDGRWTVYNMNGIRILSTENASDLNALRKGLYIINGKKVIIR